MHIPLRIPPLRHLRPLTLGINPPRHLPSRLPHFRQHRLDALHVKNHHTRALVLDADHVVHFDDAGGDGGRGGRGGGGKGDEAHFAAVGGGGGGEGPGGEEGGVEGLGAGNGGGGDLDPDGGARSGRHGVWCFIGGRLGECGVVFTRVKRVTGPDEWT